MNSSKEFKLAIIIVNYQTPQMVIDCLNTIETEICKDIHVVIVDNKSEDDSVTILVDIIEKNTWAGWVELVQSKYNGGFSSGNNIGINSIRSKYYLLLNSDTLIREGALTQLIRTADRLNNIGLLTPRLEWPDTTPQISCFNFISPISEFISSSQTGFITKILLKYNVPIPVTSKISYPKWSSFACILIKKEVFESLSLMDEEFFMYFEDVDFCYRAGTAGWKIANDPLARVVHLRGGSSPVKENTKLKKRLPRYFYESRTRYFYLRYGRVGLISANILWGIGRLISKSRQLSGRNDKAVSEYQWLDIWTNWLQPLKGYTHPGTTKRK